MRRTLKLIALFSCCWLSMMVVSLSAEGNDPPPPGPLTPGGRRYYVTQRLHGTPPKIDGKLDDAAWEEGHWAGDYRQYIPRNGAMPSEDTKLKILYDDNNIYVAIRAYDKEPARIDRKLGRRDAFIGDIVGVCFDSYFDHRTGFEFDLTAGGAKIDLILFNGGWDTTWDAIWDGKVGSEPDAWTAEMRIPLSQLRYGNQEKQVWGFHSWRWINRNGEEAQFALVPRDSPGQLYSIGELHGIEGIRKSRNIELLPYAVGRYATFGQEVGSPFKRESKTEGDLGLDGKLGVTSAFTLDFTVNPDFGQVEVDPSVLNISAFETFYEEKRPFFLEGKRIFEFDMGEELLFYSRRIGHAPSYVPELRQGDNPYFDAPASTSILGAVKFTGKTEKGLSIGIIESVTSKETATINSLQGSRSEAVEPLANYAVARVQKEFNQSNTIVGGMLTSVHRRIEDPQLEFLPRDATTAGFDFLNYWKNKTYYLDFKAVFSDVRGSTDAMLGLQRSSARYFQRPDADYVHLDPFRTQLGGHGGILEFGKGANGNWRFAENLSWRSPGLELNDLGYLQTADVITQGTRLHYVVTEPTWIFRDWSAGVEQENSWDFGGEFLSPSVSVEADGTFSNKWNASVDISRIGRQLDTRLLRGGPAVSLKGFWTTNLTLSSDGARRLSFNLRYHTHTFDDRQSSFRGIYPGLSFRITNPLVFSTQLEYSKNKDIFQYVTRTEYEDQQRNLVGTINQRTLGLTFRVDYSVTPELTIQYFGNPYVSNGLYDQFKRFTHPRSHNYSDLYHTFSGSEIQFDPLQNLYRIDESGNGVFDYSFDNPNFNFREFRSNLVARWEYKPGSVLYLVWTQGRSVFEPITNHSLRENLGNLFSTPSDNVFLVKFSYWLPF
ncbi:MAG: DUF5916 domain-containing protein [Acidobacteriota bacterium]